MYKNHFLNMKSQQWNEFDSELNGYSDVSMDNSVLSTEMSIMKYMRMEYENRYIDSYMSTLSQLGYKGDGDEEAINEFLFPKLYNRVPYSDDEMSEFFHFDQSFLQGSSTLEDHEERMHMTQLINQDPSVSENNEYCNSYTLQDYENLVYEDELSKSNSLSSTPKNRSSFCPINNIHKGNTAFCEGSLWDVRSKRFLGAQNTLERDCDPWTRIASKEERPNSNVLNKSSRNKPNPADDDDQKIFLGGLPLGIKERTLRHEMAAQGYKVLRRPKILRGFAPEVMMKSVEQAKELVDKGILNIKGFEVEVRPFNSYNKKSKSRKIPNVGRRSVFLGGLSKGTTVKDILDVMMKMNLRVMNYPVIKVGFSPQVILQTVSQAQKLVKMKKIYVNGNFVDVRPFTHQHWK